MLPAPVAGMRWSVAPPTPQEWSTLDSSARHLAASGADAERARWQAATERERLEQLRGYFAAGGRRAAAEADTLRARSALLDSLRGTLDALYARLASVRDESIRRVGLRTAAILEQCENDLLWLRGMRRFHMEGPYAAISAPAPPNLPNGGTLVVAEEELALAVRDVAERVAREAPGRIRLSYEKAWGPSLIDRIVAFGPEARRSLSWARALGGTIDSSLAAAATSETLRRLELRAAALDRSTDSLRAADQALRTRIARTAVERALAAMETEREGIDYGLAVSAYALGVHLGEGADTAGAARVMPRAGNAAAEAAEVPENPEAQHWRVLGIDRLRAFLTAHPKSPARGEMRFRLADLLLVEARRDFRERMARYLDDHGAGPRGALPVLEAGPALALYRTILAEDRDFPHRDAVLFNAGMILADDGDDGARPMFSELVTSHPDSRYGQEAWLRMGDMEFADRRFPDAVTRYQHAVEGRDPSMKVIALYKMGWAHFNQEHFTDAVESFRGVLDLYAGADSSRIQVDVEREAEGDLVQTLARAGGAEAYARAFATPATRPYEKRVLLALGQHFRRYSLLGPAAAADELFLARYPLDPDALVSAARMVETHERSGHPIDARDARLRYAPVFAPGSPWAGAQTSDSVRTAGAEFARASWKTVALEHHRAARAKNDATEWREALRLYELLVARWPDDPERATIEMNAGEAGARLARYPEALAHYDAAAKIGGDSLAAQAMWQRVVVTDDWYETSRGGRTAPGSDTLARGVLQAADKLLERFPSHPKRADLLWREGQLSFAHGWFERAADDFGHLASRDPADARAPRAAVLRADALFRIARFESAGEAYEQALGAAQRAGDDSLARRAERAIPVCAYREAEAAVAADSTNHARHAALFEKVAARWPKYEHAPLAQYRAGLSYLAAGANRDAVQAMQALIRNFPTSEYVRDARLQIARTLEADGEKERAGDAYADFAAQAGDKSARDAWLKAGDLFAAAGRTARADSVRLDYVRRYPDDQQAAMEIYEGFARRDLQNVGPGHPISALLDAPRPAAPKTAKGAKAAKAPLGPPRSKLAEYLRRAAAHPELAARDIPAQVRFLQGEEAAAACAAMPLRQPLDKSIKARQKLLDQALARYRECVALEVSEWAHAATFRIGELLIGFGEALEKSERPADLTGADLQGYQDELAEQAGVFYDRGEGVWTELLKKGAAPGSTARAAGDPKGDAKKDTAAEDEWVQKARTSLWSRIGSRFAFLPELEFPTITASAPESGRSREPHAQARPTPAPGQANLAAPREDNPR